MAEYREEKPRSEFEERVVAVDRISYTVAGGRRMRFRALVVIGNRRGRVGMGIAKAGEVQAAVAKAVTAAKKHLVNVAIQNETIPHAVQTKYGSAVVFLKPAGPGTSVIAGGSVRAVLELAGIKNILSKVIGSSNKLNCICATLEALGSLKPIASKVAVTTDSAVLPPTQATESETEIKTTASAESTSDVQPTSVTPLETKSTRVAKSKKVVK